MPLCPPPIKIFLHIHTYIYIHTYIHTYVYIHTYIHTYIHMYTHAHAHMRTYTCRLHAITYYFRSPPPPGPHRCGPSSIPGLGRGRIYKFHQLLAVGRWFPPGTPVSSIRKLTFHHHHPHRLDMTLAVAEALTPNKLNQTTLPRKYRG